MPTQTPPTSSPWPRSAPTRAERDAFAAATPRPFWLDRRTDVRSFPAPSGSPEVDLAIVGGGFSGLWAALHAKTRDPDRRVLLLEADAIGSGASGRNGGFVSASITHGIENGRSRFPDEIELLERLGMDNFTGLQTDIARLGIDCDFESTGEMNVAVEGHQVGPLAEEAELLRSFGHTVELLDREAVRAELASPTYLGGVWDRSGAALLDPGKLCAGLADAIADLGVEVLERAPVASLKDRGAAIELTAAGVTVKADRVILATNAFPSLVRSLRRYILPVYDYVLVTDPLSDDQLATIGWRSRQGLSDTGNQFHYYRLTDDNRILWGGFEAVYHYGGRVDSRYDTDEETFAALSQHFFATFPQLEGLRFSHKWGGAIDTCSRFSSFFDLSHGGKVVFVGGYTGLGVAASRFGAGVALDLADGRETEATALEYVRRKPVPFPPEPFRWGVVQFTRNRLAAADRNGGRLGIWLRLLDRFGLGFDS